MKSSAKSLRCTAIEEAWELFTIVVDEAAFENWFVMRFQ